MKEMKLHALLGNYVRNYDWQTNRQTGRPGNREASLPIRSNRLTRRVRETGGHGKLKGRGLIYLCSVSNKNLPCVFEADKDIPKKLFTPVSTLQTKFYKSIKILLFFYNSLSVNIFYMYEFISMTCLFPQSVRPSVRWSFRHNKRGLHLNMSVFNHLSF